MVDPKIFALGMGLLADRFNREISEQVNSGYYKILSNALTAEQFQIAVERCFRYSRFFPTPQEIIDAVVGSNESRAEAEWLRLMDAVRQGNTAELSLIGKKALAAIGGDWGLRTESHSHLRREFLRAYTALAQLEPQINALPLAGEGEFE